MNDHDRRGVLFGAGALGLYAVLRVVSVGTLSVPLVVGVTVGLLAAACGFCGAYFLARSLGERLA